MGLERCCEGRLPGIVVVGLERSFGECFCSATLREPCVCLALGKKPSLLLRDYCLRKQVFWFVLLDTCGYGFKSNVLFNSEEENLKAYLGTH